MRARMSRLPREQQRAILAESEETARLEKVAQIDMGRAFDFANAGRYKVAYCCRDHQKEDWKEGHKNACNEFQSHRNNPFAALKGTRDDLAAMLGDKGYDLLRHNENPDILLQDPATGEFYELISNTKVLCMGEMSAAEVALLDKSGGTSYVPVAGLVESRRG